MSYNETIREINPVDETVREMIRRALEVPMPHHSNITASCASRCVYLAMLVLAPSAPYTEVASLANVSERACYRHVKKLEKSGLIRRINPGPKSPFTWIIV